MPRFNLSLFLSSEFLNFDDADDDNAGDYAPDVEATRVIDNSGWSFLTKYVCICTNIIGVYEQK